MVKKARYIMPQNTALQREMNYRWISRVYAREKGQLKKKNRRLYGSIQKMSQNNKTMSREQMNSVRVSQG